MIRKQRGFLNNLPRKNVKGLSIAIVVSEWNSDITNNLYISACKTLISYGVNNSNIKKIVVPGSFELIYGAKIAYKSKPDVIICLGCVIKGDTDHFKFVCEAVSNGIKDLNIQFSVPVIFGVLTVDNIKQAIKRSENFDNNKGVEAAITAIKMGLLNR